jgi:hypothetical protein
VPALLDIGDDPGEQLLNLFGDEVLHHPDCSTGARVSGRQDRAGLVARRDDQVVAVEDFVIGGFA